MNTQHNAQLENQRLWLNDMLDIGKTRIKYEWNVPTVIDFTQRPDARRMGLGDIMVVIGTLQAIQKHIDAELLIIPDYSLPGADLWPASGLKVINRGEVEKYRNYQRINIDNHFHQCALGNLCDYGVERGHPGYQMLYNLGWEEHVQILPWRNDYALNARRIIQHRYATVSLAEHTRGNTYSTPERFSQAIDAYTRGVYELIFCCSEKLLAQTMDIMSQIDSIQNRLYRIHVCPALEWAGIIAHSDIHITGNSAGMWMALAVKTPMVLLSGPVTHNDWMWEPKQNWYDKMYESKCIKM